MLEQGHSQGVNVCPLNLPALTRRSLLRRLHRGNGTENQQPVVLLDTMMFVQVHTRPCQGHTVHHHQHVGKTPLFPLEQIPVDPSSKIHLFLFHNLINFSRAYQTGFSRFDIHSLFSRCDTDRPFTFQWKQRGRQSSPFLFIKNHRILSIPQRRLHESSFRPQDMGRVPDHIFHVDEDRCFGCGACVALCPVDVLTLNQRMIYVDEPNCTHCKLCIPSCPVFALNIRPM